MDDLEQGLIQNGVVPGQGVVGQVGQFALGLDVGGQGVGQLGLRALHVGVGKTGLEIPVGDGEKVGVVGGVSLVQPAVQLVHGGGQVVGGGLDGLAAARLGQQVKEDADGVDQQLLGQQGQHAPPHGVVLLIAEVVELLGGDGGAVAAQGPAQQEIGGHAVVVAGFDHEGETGLPDAVLIVAEQSLGDAQGAGGGALADPLLLPQQGERAGKFFVHKRSPQKECPSRTAGGPASGTIQYTWYSIHERYTCGKEKIGKNLCMICIDFSHDKSSKTGDRPLHFYGENATI